MRLEYLTGLVAENLSTAGIESVTLKGVALLLAGVTPAGARTMSDIDVLVPAGSAEAAREVLYLAGWRSTQGADAEHQLAPMTHRMGGTLEVHRMVRGVRIKGGRSACLEDVLEAGVRQGVVDDHYRWVTTVSKYDAAEQDTQPGVPEAYWISVRVIWDDSAGREITLGMIWWIVSRVSFSIPFPALMMRQPGLM